MPFRVTARHEAVQILRKDSNNSVIVAQKKNKSGFFLYIIVVFLIFARDFNAKTSIMALRDWMISFNNAKTMEANGEEGPELIAEYERVLAKLGEGPLTEAQENVRKEACRNLAELYALSGDEAKAEEYRQMSE